MSAKRVSKPKTTRFVYEGGFADGVDVYPRGLAFHAPRGVPIVVPMRLRSEFLLLDGFREVGPDDETQIDNEES